MRRQAVYHQDSSDPNHLDADHDGIACETLPHRSGGAPSTSTGEVTTTPDRSTPKSTGAQVQVKPSGGMDTGAGPAIALGALVLGGGGALTTIVLRWRTNR